MRILGHKIADKPLLALIGRYLRAGVRSMGIYKRPRWAMPQGGPLSPLLANIRCTS
ncbi:MAG: hypothetical protein KF778_12710 [Rhodocyclaceae bacterium]|nr:hypothetical protein [Rhodocyclaceae bacterium]